MVNILYLFHTENLYFIIIVYLASDSFETYFFGFKLYYSQAY